MIKTRERDMTDQPTAQDIADQAMTRILEALHDASSRKAMPPLLWLHEAETLIAQMIAKAAGKSQ